MRFRKHIITLALLESNSSKFHELKAMLEQNPVHFLNNYFRSRRVSDQFAVSILTQPVRFREQAYFSLHLVMEPEGEQSSDPVFSALFSSGRQSQNIHGWVDGDYFDTAKFPSGAQIRLTESGLDLPLFRMIGDLVPRGGSFMVSYSLFSKESPIHRDTKRGLDKGYPPVVTPLGFLLFCAGCGMGFKDWYFAEGGREGPEKLQGFKPINSVAAREKAQEMLNQLGTFSPTGAQDELSQACKLRAEHVARELEESYRRI